MLAIHCDIGQHQCAIEVSFGDLQQPFDIGTERVGGIVARQVIGQSQWRVSCSYEVKYPLSGVATALLDQPRLNE